MTTPSIDVLNYLRSAFNQDQISALVTQNPDGTVTITADIGPGSSNLSNQPLVGADGIPGTDQFPVQLEPDIFSSPSDLPGPGVLKPTAADIGKFWMIAIQDGDGNFISNGAYIWFGPTAITSAQFRFLPFGPAGPPGPYGTIVPTVELLPPNQTSQQLPSTGDGSPTDPYITPFALSIPQGPRGPGPTLASMADFEALTPTVGQFVTATGRQVTFEGQVLPQWAPMNTGDLPLLPFIVPQSAFIAVSGITFGNITAVVSGTIAQLTSFAGSFTSGIGSVLDGAITTLSGGTVSRGNTIGGVKSTLSTIESNLNNVLSEIGSSLTAASPLSQISFAVNSFVGTITSPIQSAVDTFLNSVGIPGIGNPIATVATAVTGTLQGVIQQIENALNGDDIPTIAAFTVPALPWAWKPIVLGQIRMFEAEFSLQPLLMGIEVTLGWPGGITVARGFGNTLSGVVNVMPHTSWPGNPSFAMNPWNSVGFVPANTPGSLFVNIVNDGIAAIYDYNPSDAQIIVMACPVTTQAQLGLSVPTALQTKLSLQVASVFQG
jgi:hypothetical protein